MNGYVSEVCERSQLVRRYVCLARLIVYGRVLAIYLITFYFVFEFKSFAIYFTFLVFLLSTIYLHRSLMLMDLINEARFRLLNIIEDCKDITSNWKLDFINESFKLSMLYIDLLRSESVIFYYLFKDVSKIKDGEKNV